MVHAVSLLDGTGLCICSQELLPSFLRARDSCFSSYRDILAVCQNIIIAASDLQLIQIDINDYVAFCFMQVMQGSQLRMDPKINEL